jgi:hypothetical protein
MVVLSLVDSIPCDEYNMPMLRRLDFSAYIIRKEGIR